MFTDTCIFYCQFIIKSKIRMLFCPVPVRPWTISDISIDPDEVAQYVYKYTFSQMKWLAYLEAVRPAQRMGDEVSGVRACLPPQAPRADNDLPQVGGGHAGGR